MLPLMPYKMAQKCNFVILQISLDVNRKRVDGENYCIDDEGVV